MLKLANIGVSCAAACFGSLLLVSIPATADEPSTFVSDATSEIYRRSAEVEPGSGARSHPVPYDEHSSSFVHPGITPGVAYSSGAVRSAIDQPSSHPAPYDEHTSTFVTPGTF
jgi:hypothetical protein